jgi:hypothetical protein
MYRPHPRLQFTSAEDAALVDLVHEIGLSDWDKISARLPGRNPRQCRDRWFNYLSPDVQNRPWTAEEEQRLLKKRA